MSRKITTLSAYARTLTIIIGLTLAACAPQALPGDDSANGNVGANVKGIAPAATAPASGDLTPEAQRTETGLPEATHTPAPVGETPTAAAEAEVIGVATVIGPAEWTVNGVRIAVTARTEIKGAIQVDATVEVQGVLRADGSVLAREIGKLARTQVGGDDGDANANAKASPNASGSDDSNFNDNQTMNANENRNENEAQNHNEGGKDTEDDDTGTTTTGMTTRATTTEAAATTMAATAAAIPDAGRA